MLSLTSHPLFNKPLEISDRPHTVDQSLHGPPFLSLAIYLRCSRVATTTTLTNSSYTLCVIGS